LAVTFLVVIFLIKTTSTSKNNGSSKGIAEENSLTYSNVALEDLVQRDTDHDGVLDWEEGLWGTDPTKKETTDGTPDGAAIAKLESEHGSGTEKTADSSGIKENLTNTDQLSRELFSTIASLTQNGAIDQDSIDHISNSLAEKIQNSAQRKVYTISDIKIAADNVQAFQKYNAAMDSIRKKYPVQGNTFSILQKFIADGENPNVAALGELDKIVKPLQNVINAIAKMDVPKSISPSHLDFLNGLEKLMENLNDIKLFGSDPIMAIGGITQYQASVTSLEKTLIDLAGKVKIGLKS